MDDSSVYRREFEIEATDIDELGHVNNVTWLRFVVQMAEAHSSSVGLDFETYKQIGGFWVVRRHEIDYHGQAVQGDVVYGETWVENFKGARSDRQTRIHTADGSPLISAMTQWVYVDARTQRPRRVDPSVAERFPVREATT